MNELDEVGLRHIRDWAQTRIDAHDKRQRLAPLRDAMQKQIEAMQTQVVPDLLAETTAQARRSLLSLEESLAKFPERLRDAEAQMDAVLAAAQGRTASLRCLLEALSS